MSPPVIAATVWWLPAMVAEVSPARTASSPAACATMTDASAAWKACIVLPFEAKSAGSPERAASTRPVQ